MYRVLPSLPLKNVEWLVALVLIQEVLGKNVSRDSVVSIMTCYGLDGLGFDRGGEEILCTCPD